nr:hypothetical protein [Tanacetum cinerariifolium]
IQSILGLFDPQSIAITRGMAANEPEVTMGAVLDGGDSSVNNQSDDNQTRPDEFQVIIKAVLGDYGSRIENNDQSIAKMSDMLLGLST